MKALWLILLFGMAYLSAAGGSPDYDPANTRVAIIPLVNASEEKWEELKQKQVDRGNEVLHESFIIRGFQVIDQATIADAMHRLDIDLSDEEQQKRDTLYRLGNEVGANLIVFALVTGTEQKVRDLISLVEPPVVSVGPIPPIDDITKRVLSPFIPARREGNAKLKLWLLDVQKQKAIITAKTAQGRSIGGYFAFLDKGSKRQVAAVGDALKLLLKDFFKPYPIPK